MWFSLEFLTAALGFLSTVDVVVARPNPKVPNRIKWTHGRGQKHARAALKRALDGRSRPQSTSSTSSIRTSTSSTPTSSTCVTTSLRPTTSATKATSSSSSHASKPTASSSDCAEAKAASITAPHDNIWAGLTDAEAVSIVAWLFSKSELNLTATADAGAWDNTIVLVELHVPDKSDAVAYADGKKAAPTRYAHVVVDHRATIEPYFQDLLVGPLPLNNKTASYKPLDYTLTRKTSGKVRNLDADSEALYSEWLYVIGAEVADITMDLWGGSVTGSDNDTLDIWGIDPLWQDNGHIVRWDMFWNLPTDELDAETLLPLGLYVKSDVTGRDPSKWTVQGWLYDNIFYSSTQAFKKAYWSGQVQKLPANKEGSWDQTDPQGVSMPYDTNYPPTMVAPSGSRFSVDYSKKYVEWMGWSFYISFSRDSGMALYDIKFQGERLLYELGLQEALAHYAGGDPVQSGTSYLDSYYGFGPFAFELVSGYDCPEYAVYLNSTFYVDETTHTHINSICLFEFTSDYPMQRHSTGRYVSNTKNTYFSVRSVSTVGNYDYMFTYGFYMDGSISVEVRASGYIQSAYYTTGSDFGYKIQKALSGSMHDHVLNFKADFDILGTSNSIQLLENVPVTRTFPWSNGEARNTMQLKRSFIDNEKSSRFNWGANSAQQVIVVNKNEKNKWGEYRGYRLLPMTAPAHLTVIDSSNLVNAAHWAEYDLAVTRQHNSEPRSAHAYNSQDVTNPPVDFSKFFNGESLDQEDLVVWFNLGMHHVPHTGDLPNTVFTTAHAGVQILPSNYFEIDQSRRTVNTIRINYGNGTSAEVLTFGQKDAMCAADFTPAEQDLDNYVGDVVIRKFPFDPNNPYYETDSVV